MRSLALALVLTIVWAAPLRPARADWQVTRSPFDPALVARYKQRLTADPDDASTLSRLTALYRRYRSVDQLIAEYRAKADRDHRFSDEQVLGHLYRARGDHARAVERYRQALQARPGDERAELALAGELEQLKKDDQARSLYLAALATTSDTKGKRAILQKLAALAPDRGLPKAQAVAEARTYYDQLLALDPRDDATRRALASALEQAGDYEGAAAEWRKLIGRLGGDPAARTQAWLHVGELEESGGHDDRAQGAYQRAYGLAPRGTYLRRAAIEKLIGVARKHDELRALAGTWERDWPERERTFLEWDTLARLYDELGDAARAQDDFRKALALDPHAVDARRKLISLLERQQRDSEVIAEYRKLIASAPGEPRFRIELATKLWAQGGSKEAEAITAALGRETRDPAVHGQLAELYQRWSESATSPEDRKRLAARALAERELLVKLEPNEASHLVDLGELYFQRGQKPRALATWRKLLGLGGKRATQMARLADVYADHDLPGEALELYQKAVKLAPDDLEIAKGRAAALERMHRDGEAAEAWQALFDRALAQKKTALALEARGRLITGLARTGQLASRLPELRSRFDRASDPAIRTGYGLATADAALKLDRPDEAESVLIALEKGAPPGDHETRADALVGLAEVYRARHQPKRVIEALEAAAKLSPGRARELYSRIAQLSLELYRDSDALSYAKRAVELGPTSAQAQLRLAEVLEKRDQLDPAIAAYQRALELDDRQWKTHFVLARLLLRRGEYAPAAKLYRDVIRRAPDEDLVVDAARRALDLDEYLGSLEELEHELEPLAYAHPEKRVYRNLLLELYHRYAEPLLTPAQRGDAVARARLSRLGEHALRPLLDVLVDGEPAQKKLAVSLLGELGNPSAAAPLFKLAAPRTGKAPIEIDLRVGAAIAAAELATAKDAPALARLASDPEKEIRIAALVGLGRIGRAGAKPETALAHALSDSSDEAAAAACLGLARQRAPHASLRALGEVIRLLRDPGRPELAREACAIALGTLGGAPEHDLGLARQALLDTLAEGGGAVEIRAAWAYGQLAPPGPLPEQATAALVSAVFVERDPMRRAALFALAHRPAPFSFSDPPRDTDGFDLRGLLATLGRPADQPQVAPSSWRGAESAIGRAIAEALSSHHDRVLRTLVDLDARPDGLALGPLTTSALGPGDRAALAELGAALLAPIEKRVHDPDPQVRAAAVQVLAKLPGGFAAVRAALTDSAPEVRRAATLALGSCPAYGDRPQDGAEAIDALSRALGSADWRERLAAAQAIDRALGCRSGAARRLAPALTSTRDRDESGYVREAAAQALSRVRPN